MKKYLLFIICFFVSINFLNAQTSHTVQVSNFQFSPMNVNITVGDTVKWQWVNGIHTTTSDSMTGSNHWDAPMDNTDQTFRFVITSPGIHHYYCFYHQGTGMVGTITAVVPTGVKDNKTAVNQFRLEQNYPNPFNPSTVISYSLNNPGLVTLKIYNSLGEEVTTLVNENQAAGDHSVIFNASGDYGRGSLASGIYFYRLKSGSFDQTRKMLLLK